MPSKIHHLQFRIDFSNLDFYKRLFTELDWKVVAERPNIVGFADESGTQIWFVDQKESPNTPTIFEHLAIRVSNKSEFSKMLAYVQTQGIELDSEMTGVGEEFLNLHNGEQSQFVIRTPDSIKIEVNWIKN